MAKSTFEIQFDIPEIKRIKNNVSSADVKSELEEAIAVGTAKAVKTIKSVTPVDTGKLRDSIHVSSLNVKRSVIKTNTDYAWYVHTGKGRGPAQPYMKEGLEMSEDDIRQAYLDHIEEIFIDIFN